MAELLVRATLPDFDKSDLLDRRDHFARLQHRELDHRQLTSTSWVPTNSASTFGSPSSRSILTTSRRFAFSSSRVSPCVCAPGKPGMKPTYNPVSASRSTTAVKLLFMRIA